MYKLTENAVTRLSDNASIPLVAGNTDYQQFLDWINEGNTPTGADIIEPDYVSLRTGADGYASTGDQLGMIADGTQAAHVTDVKTRFPKTITGGTTIGDVPQDILDAAAEKLFNTQATDYRTATARVAQYQLSVGRSEVTESQPTGEQVWNEETFEMDDVMADVITQTEIEPLEATVEVTTYDSSDLEAEPTTETVANPLIVADDAERAEAQTVIDNTPTPVKEHVDNE